MTSEIPSSNSPLSDLAPFAAVELIAVDIDGTLATAQGQEVADHVKRAVRSLSYYGVTVTVATGRAVAGAQDTIFGLNRRLGPAIVYNGAVVVDLARGQLLTRSLIGEGEVAKLRDLTLRFGASMWAYDCTELSLDRPGAPDVSGVIETVHGWSPTLGPAVELNGLPVSWSNSHSEVGPAVAVLIARSGGDLEQLLRELRVIPTISITSSTPDYLEIRPIGTTKASALAIVAGQRRLAPHKVLTIGDNHNDVEMLEWAGISVAVANATDTARHAATHTTTQSDARGVVEVLRLVASAKRFARGYAVSPSVD